MERMTKNPTRRRSKKPPPIKPMIRPTRVRFGAAIGGIGGGTFIRIMADTDQAHAQPKQDANCNNDVRVS
jgi:hypothetical protein